jgi:hypothetical protein
MSKSALPGCRKGAADYAKANPPCQVAEEGGQRGCAFPISSSHEKPHS